MPHSWGRRCQQDWSQFARTFRPQEWSGRGLLLYRCQQVEGRSLEWGDSGTGFPPLFLAYIFIYVTMPLTHTVTNSSLTSRTLRSTFPAPRWPLAVSRKPRTATIWSRTFCCNNLLVQFSNKPPSPPFYYIFMQKLTEPLNYFFTI